MALSPLRQHGARFLDDTGRHIILRGVNLGGDCKVPFPDGGTHYPSDFSNHRRVSFIGRPFPLAEADEHFARLRRWGFNVVRLLTTWEAVEHAGPGQHDKDYLAYFTEICARAADYGIYVFVDFHQDVWSRMSGGDGAPGWTFEAVGLDFTKFHAADCAHIMQAKYDYTSAEALQDAYPPMSWGSNYRLPANGIMWTLFWAGKILTPDFKIEGTHVQDFLQGCYLGSMAAIARRIRHLPNVLGFDTLNEPGIGWLGERLSYRHVAPTDENPTRARIGPALSPLDALAMARGIATTVPVLTRNHETGNAEVTGETTLNPNGIAIWRDGARCPFETAGAYTINNGQAVALNDNFFRHAGGDTIDVSETGYGPFFHKVAATIARENTHWSVFAEMDPFGAAAGRRFPAVMPAQSVNASHWYDVAALYLKTFDLTKHFDYMTGARESDEHTVRERYIRQLRAVRDRGQDFPGGAPTLIGEFGIPYDLDHGAAYRDWAAGKREGVWDTHVQALTLMYDALDRLLLHSTQWNYTVSNRNDLRIGDGWNQEDLSVFSRDQRDDAGDPDSGGRALAGFCRPYVQRTQGRLLAMRFSRAPAVFYCEFEADPAIDAPTVLYVPRVQFPDGFVVRIEGAPAELDFSAAEQWVEIKALARETVKVWVQAGAPAQDLS